MKNFEGIPEDQIVFKGSNFFIIKDSFPVSPGHLLIISNSDKKDYFDLEDQELEDLNVMIRTCKGIIEKEYKPDGYNIGMNCGVSAGQTVFQFHCHVIPRYNGDMKDPRGGVRHCIAGKGYYEL
ncbi:MAG: HIT family protein [Bacteroidales bacterium]|nr:HIT family protein [Bacteroidales bacterium]